MGFSYYYFIIKRGESLLQANCIHIACGSSGTQSLSVCLQKTILPLGIGPLLVRRMYRFHRPDGNDQPNVRTGGLERPSECISHSFCKDQAVRLRFIWKKLIFKSTKLLIGIKSTEMNETRLRIFARTRQEFLNTFTKWDHVGAFCQCNKQQANGSQDEEENFHCVGATRLAIQMSLFV